MVDDPIMKLKSTILLNILHLRDQAALLTTSNITIKLLIYI